MLIRPQSSLLSSSFSNKRRLGTSQGWSEDLIKKALKREGKRGGLIELLRNSNFRVIPFIKYFSAVQTRPKQCS